MVDEILKKLLDQYKVKENLINEIRNGYRNPIEDDLNNYYQSKPNYRYGGSLAKGTANKNSCDIDLLCYFDSDYEKNVETVYKETSEALKQAGYIYNCKNSAINVTGKYGESQWDYTIDIVPGKYTSNELNKDVYLWCNKTSCKLKSNPEVQIEKVKKSNCKEVIRLIKLYRTFNNFKFKSFYLEIFAIDIVSSNYNNNDTLYTKLIKFCECYDKIGNVKIYDPANSNNDINLIHDEYEFIQIRKYIKKLYDALLTNDDETIKNCILGKTYNLDAAYLSNAKSHSSELSNKNNALVYYSPISLTGYYLENDNWIRFDSNTVLEKGKQLRFEIYISNSIQIKTIGLIISNAGYEAMIANCLRGGIEKVNLGKRNNSKIYYRDETTSYKGNHFVQAVFESTNGGKYYSQLLTVRIN